MAACWPVDREEPPPSSDERICLWCAGVSDALKYLVGCGCEVPSENQLEEMPVVDSETERGR
jgi:hypothetical protein